MYTTNRMNHWRTWGGITLAFTLFFYSSAAQAEKNEELCFSITSSEVPSAPVLFITLGLKDLKNGHYLVSGSSCNAKGSDRCGPLFGNAEIVESDNIELLLTGADLNTLETTDIADDLFASVQTHVILNFDTGNGTYSSHVLITVGNRNETSQIFQDSGTVKAETCAPDTSDEEQEDKRLREFLDRMAN